MDQSAESLLKFCSINSQNYQICHDWNIWNQFAQNNFQLSLDLVSDDLPPIELYQRLADLYQNHPQELIVPLILSGNVVRLQTFLEYAPLIRPINIFTGAVELSLETERALAVAVDSGNAEILNLLLNELTRYGMNSVSEILDRTYQRAALEGRSDLLEVIIRHEDGNNFFIQ